LPAAASPRNWNSRSFWACYNLQFNKEDKKAGKVKNAFFLLFCLPYFGSSFCDPVL